MVSGYCILIDSRLVSLTSLTADHGDLQRASPWLGTDEAFLFSLGYRTENWSIDVDGHIYVDYRVEHFRELIIPEKIPDLTSAVTDGYYLIVMRIVSARHHAFCADMLAAVRSVYHQLGAVAALFRGAYRSQLLPRKRDIRTFINLERDF